MGRLYSLLIFTLLITGCSSVPTRTTTSDGFDNIYDNSSLTAEMLGVGETAYAEALARGEQALSRGDTDRAAAFFVRAIEQASDKLENTDDKEVAREEVVTAALKLAVLYRHLGMQALSENVYQLILQMDDQQTHALEAMGLIRLRQRQTHQARDYFQNSVNSWITELSNDPEPEPMAPVQALNGLGVIADLSGNHALAGHYFTRALRFAPNNGMLMNNYGYSLYLDGKSNDAEYWFSKALNVAPEYTQAQQNLALIKVRQQAFNEAIDIFKQSMHHWEALHEVGILAVLAGHDKEAESLFLRALDASPVFYAEAWSKLELLRKSG